MSIRAKPIEDVTFNRAVGDGYSGTQSWIVEGLTGGDALEKAYQALQAPELPKPGEFYPAYALNTIVRNVSAKPMTNPTKAKVVVTVGRPEAQFREPDESAPGTVFVGMTLQEFETAYNVDGQQIITTREVTDSDGNTTLEELPGTVSALFPVMVLGATRRESNTPADKARDHVGKLNSLYFGGEDPGRWLCVRLEGDSEDDGETYDVTYEFHRSPLFRYGTASDQTYSGWDALVVHQEDGRPIKDPVLGESLKIIRLYEEINHNVLGLGL